MEEMKRNFDWFEGVTLQETQRGKRQHKKEEETNCSFISGCFIKGTSQVFKLGSTLQLPIGSQIQ